MIGSRYITGPLGRENSPDEDQAEVIRRALEYLDTENKWLQGRVADDDRRCIAGAVQEALTAVSAERDRNVVVDLAPTKDLKFRIYRDGYIFIEDWNDDPMRTFADVKAYLADLYEYYAGEEWSPPEVDDGDQVPSIASEPRREAVHAG